MVRRGRRFESVRGLCKTPAKRGVQPPYLVRGVLRVLRVLGAFWSCLMPAKRYSVEQIVAKLREAEKHQGQG